MKRIVLYFLCTLVFVSCEKSAEPILIPENLNGKWALERASCFCFFPEDFDFSQHKIDFNNSNNSLVVENAEDTFFVSKAGTYNFQVQGDTIIIDDSVKYTFEIQQDSLIMSFVDNPEIADDEISLWYKRM